MLPASSITGLLPRAQVSGDSVDPKQMALETCVARIKHMMQEIKLSIPSGNANLNKIGCVITWEAPKDPVVTNCGHIFDRAAIQAWMAQTWTEQSRSCPQCRKPMTAFTPVPQLRALIEEWLQEDRILNFSHFKGLNQGHAAKYLGMAQSFVDEKEYSEALEMYNKAFQYTNSSVEYAVIPHIYDQLGETKKATLSRLYLSLYQIQEGKVREAAETLKSCQSDAITPVFVEFILQLCQSPETFKWAMARAADQNNLEDRILIYKQILAQDPYQFDAHEQLISLTKDLKEKRELLLKAADLAHEVGLLELEISFREQARSPLTSTVIYYDGRDIGVAGWRKF